MSKTKTKTETAAEWVPIGDLTPWSENPRKNEAAVSHVAESIQRFGFASPIIARTGGEVIAGHTRLLAAQQLGLDRVPVRYMDLDPVDAKLLALADNKVAEIADWDDEALERILSELKADGVDLDGLGWSDDELAEILNEEVEGLTDEDQVPEPPEQAVTVEGDLWILGDHRLLCGDSTKLEVVERLMDGQKADMVFTDPPYNVAYEGKTKDSLKIKNDSMSDADFSDMLTKVFSNLYYSMNEGAPIYVTCPLEDGAFHSAFISAGLKLQSILIWLKNTMVMGRKDYHYKHEPILYGWKQGAAHYWRGGRNKTSVIECNRPSRNGQHPTMKPVELIEILLGNSGRTDAIVSDLYGGSGSTLIACEKTNRNCYMMELDPIYVDVIINRWQDFTGSKATLESTGQTYDEMKGERLASD